MSLCTPTLEHTSQLTAVARPLSHERLYRIAVLAVVAVPALLGFYRLEEPSIWFDEAATWLNVSDGWRWMWIASASGEDCGGFVYALVIKLWTSVFGYGEFALRAPSVVFAAAMSWTLLRIGHGMGSLRAGVCMALCGSLHPVVLCWSRQARAYSLEMFLTAAYLALILAYARSGGRMRAAALTLVGSLLALSHIFGVFVVVGGALFLLAPRFERSPEGSAKPVRRSLAPSIIVGLLWFAWIALMQGRIKQNLDAFWIHGSIIDGYGDVLRTLISWCGPIALLSVAVLGLLRRRRSMAAAPRFACDRRLLLASGFIAAMVLIGPAATSALSRGAHHFILPRYFMPGVVPVVVLAGALLASLPRKFSVGGILLLGAAGLYSAAEAGVFSDAGEDGSRTRAAASYLAANFRKGDRIYLNPQFEESTLRYYGLPPRMVRGVGYYGQRDVLRDRLLAEPPQAGTRNWVLVYNCDDGDDLRNVGLANCPQQRFGTIRLACVEATPANSTDGSAE